MSFCEKHGLSLIETSAKDSTNVTLAFETLLKEVIKQRLKNQLTPSSETTAGTLFNVNECVTEI